MQRLQHKLKKNQINEEEKDMDWKSILWNICVYFIGADPKTLQVEILPEK